MVEGQHRIIQKQGQEALVCWPPELSLCPQGLGAALGTKSGCNVKQDH